MTLNKRLMWAASNIPNVECSKVIVWEDPAFQNMPCQITSISPKWMACAQYGNILPSLDAFHEMEFTIIQVGGKEYKGVKQLELDDMLFDFSVSGKAIYKQILTNHRLDDDIASPMTEDESIEYIIKIATPNRVWFNAGSNYNNFRIVNKNELPKNRKNRNYWALKQDGEPIQIKLPTFTDIRNESWGLQ